MPHGVTVVADVRSHPYSRFNPQYNKRRLVESLSEMNIEYVFLGDLLGVRSKNAAHYREGKVQYGLLAQSPEFAEGLARVRAGMEKYRVALMCAEKDPLVCHRAILVCRYLREQEIRIEHIHPDGSLETTAELEMRLLRACGLPEGDLLAGRGEMVERAYDIQSERIAYKMK